MTGIDFSGSMLEKARERAARKGLRSMRLLQMDAGDLKFADDSFDIVYAPYLISVVPDPVKVAQEMRRVCRPGGRIIFLNHFLSPNPILSRLERMISPLHDSHRVQGGPRPAGVPGAGRPRAGLDREGELPADLVARHGRQVSGRPSPDRGLSPRCCSSSIAAMTDAPSVRGGVAGGAVATSASSAFRHRPPRKSSSEM